MTHIHEISLWFDDAISQKATHMLVVCDTFSMDDYPIPVSASRGVQSVIDEYNAKSMQRVKEVYNLSMDKAAQLDSPKCWNI